MSKKDIMPGVPAQRPFHPISRHIRPNVQSSPRDPLSRLQKRLLALAGSGARIVATHSRPWASATFIGAQHLITLAIEEAADGTAGLAFAEQLPEAEFAIPGHIVADAVVDSRETRVEDGRTTSLLRLTFLTIEDW